jgi:hypothetical protein
MRSGPGLAVLEASLRKDLERLEYPKRSWVVPWKMGFGGASISGMKYSLPKLVSAITRQLYREDKDAHFESLMSFDVKEFEP